MNDLPLPRGCAVSIQSCASRTADKKSRRRTALVFARANINDYEFQIVEKTVKKVTRSLCPPDT
jgi:hypothetical protein